VCKRMMDAIARFWWGRDDKSNKMHWYAWWKLCCPKRERERVVWGSEIFTPLTLQCWLNRSGDLLLIDICYVQSCLVLNIILMVIYWEQDQMRVHLLPGKVLLLAFPHSSEAIFGAWV
jgi:hypothetical protein